MFKAVFKRTTPVLVALCSVVISSCASDDFRGALLGHPATHWSPPEGKSAIDRQGDLAACNYPSIAYFSCMKSKGYRAIEMRPGKPLSEEELAIIQKDNIVQVGIFALDLRTKDIFTGVSTSILGLNNSSISLNGLRTKASCEGNSKLDATSALVKGTTGSAKLICTDGRVINASFVYESSKSGFGVGHDLSGVKYQFIFGDFEIDEGELLKAFREQFKNKPLPLKGQNT
jgi:hypothetical protein